MTVLDADGIEKKLILEEMDDLPDTFLQTYKSTITGTPDHYLKYGDFIYLRPYPDYSEASGLRAYFNRPLLKFDFNTFTVTIATPGVVTLAAHGLVAGDTVMLETDGALPTGLAVDTVYYVVATVSDNTFSLSTTKGGTAITTSGSQSGIHYLVETSKVPGILVDHHPYLARYASLPFLIEKSLPQINKIKRLIIEDELDIKDYFTHRDKDKRDIIKNRITPFR